MDDPKAKAVQEIADAAALHGGDPPKGMFAEIALREGVDRSTVWRWWYVQTSDEQRATLCNDRARAIKQQREHLQERATYILDQLLDAAQHAAEMAADGETRTVVGKDRTPFDVPYMNPNEITSMARMLRDVAWSSEDAEERVKRLEILFNDRPIPDKPPARKPAKH